MAGWRQTWRLLQLLVIFSLLILTNQSEMRGEAEEKLNLRGTSEEDLIISTPSLKNKQLLLHHKVLGAVLVGSDQQTMADRLQSAAEEVLVPTRSSDPSDGNTRQENGSEPQQRLPVSMKLLYNQTVCGSEPDQQNPKMEADPVPRTSRTSRPSRTPRTSRTSRTPRTSRTSRPSRTSRTPRPPRTSRTSPSPDEPLVQFDQQHIVMLADDEVVRTAAASLYHKHPAVSSLHAVRPQHRVRRVKGRAAPLSERGRLVLVGHGAREPSGEMRISGYGYQDVARIIQSSSRIGQKIQTTALVACGAGSDRRFPQALLQTLRRAGLETELHLWETDVQVAETGDVLSQDGARWRSGDHSKKLVLTVGRTGDIRRRDDRRRCTGQEVATNQTALLGDDEPNFREQWPTAIRSFIDNNIYEKIVSYLTSLLGHGDKIDSKNDNNIVDRNTCPKEEPTTINDPKVYNKVAADLGEKKIKETFRILQSLTWGFFHPKPKEEIKPQELCEKDSIASHIIIGERKKNQQSIHFENDNNKKKILLKNCFAIKTGRDVRNIIRHFGNNEKNEITHLMVNNWIYEVDPVSLYVYPVGKKLDNNEASQNAINNIEQNIRNQMDKESYQDIRPKITGKGNEEEKNRNSKECVQYFKNIFLGEFAYIPSREKEAWCTTYFTASVISESARNFRTFPLTLMALSMDATRFWFDPNYITMAAGGTWLNKPQRGFSGAAGGDLDKLAALLVREYRTINEWQEGQNEEAQFTKMFEIAEKFKVLNSKEKDDFTKDCKTFYDDLKNQQNLPSVSGCFQHQ